MRQIKKTTPVSPSQTDALPRVSQDLICSPQLTHNASSSPPAQSRCLAWLSPPNPAWTSPLLSIPFISPHRIQYKFTDHWECLLFYGGLDGGTTAWTSSAGRRIQHVFWHPICHIIYIHQPFTNRIHSNTDENDWKLLWLAPLSRRPSSSDVGLELLAKAKP